jgi:hypothetical protein
MKIITSLDKKKIGVLIVLFFLATISVFFNKVFLGYKPSASNLTYQHSTPWKNIYDVNTSGPLLSDPVDAFYPHLTATNKDLRNGEINYWESSISLGENVTELKLSSLFFVFNYIIYLFSPEQVDIGMFFQKTVLLFLSLLGMFLLLRKKELGLFACLTGAIMYTYSGVNVVWLLWPHTSVTLLAPLFFFFFDQAVFEKKKWAFLSSSLLLATMFLAGMPAYVAYFLCLIGLYFLFHLITHTVTTSELFSSSLIFTLIVLLGVGLAFMYLGELYTSINASGYFDMRSVLYQAKLPSEALNELFFPKAIHLPGHYNERSFYIGSMGTVLYLLSLLFIKDNKKILFWFLMSSLVLLLVFTPIFDVLLKHFPFLNTSPKRRMIIIFSFSASILSAYVIDGFVKKTVNKHKGIIALALVFLVFFLKYLQIKPYINNIVSFSVVLTTSLVFVAILAGSLFIKNKNWISSSVLLLTTTQILTLGMHYIPYVEKNAPVYPLTASVDYIQENSEFDRVVAIGEWSIYPNLSQAYEFYDFRGHGFGNINQDYKNLSLAADGSSIPSATRNIITKIDDIYPLSLAGVKYILYETLPRTSNLTSEDYIQKPLGHITEGVIISQRFSPKVNNLDTIDILFATYSRKLKDKNNLFFKIIDSKTGVVLREDYYPVNLIKDNEYFTFKFEALKNIQGSILEIVISTDSQQENAPTVLVTTERKSDYPLFVNGEERDSSLIFRYDAFPFPSSLNFEKKFNDGMFLFENKKALGVVYISRNIETKENLDYSDLDFVPMVNERKIYIDYDIDYDIVNTPLENEEYVDILIYDDDNVKVDAYTKYPSIIVFSDTFDENWRVYVNGSKEDIIRVNDLFKGVFVPEGKSHIEFVFKAVSWKTFVVPIASLLVLIVICLAWGKIYQAPDNI